MKKVFYFFIIFFLLSSKARWVNIADDIKSNFEYINIETDQLYINTAYQSNWNNTYYIVWSLWSYNIDGTVDINYFKQKFNKNNLLFLLNNKTWEMLAFEKDKNLFDKNKCKQISDNARILFEAYNEVFSVNYSNNIFGKDWDTNQCYTNKNTVFFPKYTNFVDDLNYFLSNADTLLNKINNIKITYSGSDKNMSILKSLYEYVIKWTDYNFEVLENSSKYNIWYDYPRTVKWFFDGKKIVCWWYVEVFDVLSKLYWIKTNIVVWSIQNLDKQIINTNISWHAWISIWELYFDPTLDDDGKKVSYNYFGKTKTCFNINHYVDWWKNFNSGNERFEYIKSNAWYLIYNCPQIVYSAITNDWKTIEFMKYILENFDLEANQKWFCQIFNICLNENSKENLLQKLKNYSYTISDWSNSTKYNLQNELSNINLKEIKTKDFTEKSSFNIELFPNLNSKIQINNLFQKMKNILKTKNENDLQNFYNKFKTKIWLTANNSKMSIEKRLKRIYLDSIFLVENLR